MKLTINQAEKLALKHPQIHYGSENDSIMSGNSQALLRLTTSGKSTTLSVMMTGLFRIIVYGLIAYVIFLVYRFFRAINQGSKRHRINKQPSGIMVKDETCNTYLPKEDAIRIQHEGKDYYFCSQECKQKFLSSHEAR